MRMFGIVINLFSFYNFIVPLEYLPWKIRDTFPGESQLLQSRSAHPTVHAFCICVCVCVYNPTNSAMDNRIFNIFAYVFFFFFF